MVLGRGDQFCPTPAVVPVQLAFFLQKNQEKKRRSIKSELMGFTISIGKVYESGLKSRSDSKAKTEWPWGCKDITLF